jgi:hypothetical protein
MCSCVFDLLLKNKQKPALMMRPQGLFASKVRR